MQWTQSAPLKRADDCPGYTASNVQKTDRGITADLTLAGAECNVYGTDLHDLKFEASYQTGELRNMLLGLLTSPSNNFRKLYRGRIALSTSADNK